jgi:hypothetical protein
MRRLNIYNKLKEKSDVVAKLPPREANTLDIAISILRDNEVQKIVEHTFDRNQRIRKVRKQLKYTT